MSETLSDLKALVEAPREHLLDVADDVRALMAVLPAVEATTALAQALEVRLEAVDEALGLLSWLVALQTGNVKFELEGASDGP